MTDTVALDVWSPDHWAEDIFGLVIVPDQDTLEGAIECVRKWAIVEKRGGLVNAWAKYQIARIITKAERSYGDRTIVEAARALSCERTYIYSWLGIAHLTEQEARRVLRERPTLIALKNALIDKERALGVYKEETEDIIKTKEARLERAALALAREVDDLLSLKSRRADVLDGAHIDGLALAVLEEVDRARQAIHMETLTYRSERFKEFVRSLPCCVCGTTNNDYIVVHAHHAEVGGLGIKGSDLSCVPLCAKHHDEAEGTAGFWGKHEVDLGHIGWMVTRRYIELKETNDAEAQQTREDTAAA